MKSNYQQLTYEQRCQISALVNRGFSQREIAQDTGVNQSTISRELARNRGLRGYRYKQAQRLADGRRQAACKPSKMKRPLISLVESKLRLQWSPEQISGWLLTQRGIRLSYETLYLHVWSDKQAGGDLYTQLRRQGKKYDKRRNGKSTRGHIKDRRSIDERPEIVDRKARVGDWEIDTVIGKGHSGALVTLVERATMKTLSARVNHKSAAEVAQATIDLLKPYRSLVHTITADNGKEFTHHQKISEALEADVYFAHPYSSWERGLNENTNGLIRQYFPKSTDFKQVAKIEVRQAVRRLNTRPRKTLGYKTPNQLWAEHMATLTA